MTDVKITKEQSSILEMDTRVGKINKVVAYAGCGKTFILSKLARKIYNHSKSTKILYLAYNKAIAEEARKKMPWNTTTATTHSIAYANVGRLFPGYQLSTPKKPRIASNVPQAYKKNSRVKWAFANSMWEVVCNYMGSIDKTISDRHLPEFTNELVKTEDLISASKSLWNKMKNPKDSFPITHDGYLKLYQLTNPRLDSKYDVILLDEAQDANGPTIGILQNCKEASVVYVGDPHQQIYSFRGSVNAMDQIDGGDHRLTKSFRFGKNVAKIASKILRQYKGETIPVRGVAEIKDTVRFTSSFPKKKPITYISRTNAELFDMAIKCMESNNEFHFIGGIDTNFAESLKDVYYLYMNNKSQMRENSFYKFFDDSESLMMYALASQDYEAIRLLSMVKQYGTKTIPHVDALKDMQVKEKEADIILTTAHKAKGLEWDKVFIAKDFALPLEKLTNPEKVVHIDEANLIYVACTRAMKSLRIHTDLQLYLG